MTYYKYLDDSEVLSMPILDRAFRKAGGVPIPLGNRVPPEVFEDLGRRHPEIVSSVRRGEQNLVMDDYKAWQFGDDIADATGYHTEQVHDPMIRVLELVQGRTSNLVKEILEKQRKISFTTYALSRGTESSAAQLCIRELANAKNVSPQRLYKQYMDAFLNSWIQAVHSPATRQPIKRMPARKPQYAKVMA